MHAILTDLESPVCTEDFPAMWKLISIPTKTYLNVSSQSGKNIAIE